MKKEKKWNALAILNILMTNGGYLSTKQLCRILDCDRKTVYNSIALLEINGFGIEVVQKPGLVNYYKYIGLFGL